MGDLFALDSKVMGEPRKVIVWTPPGYEAATASFPVLVSDGRRASVRAHRDDRRVPVAQRAHAAHGGRRRVQHRPDTRPHPLQGQGGRHPVADGRRRDRFLQFFETELVPWVESHYRTQQFRAFAGHSFGGLFAMHAMATRPDLFNAIIAVSPSLPWRQGEAVKRIDAMLAQQRDDEGTLYVTLGDEGQAMKAGLDGFASCSRKRPARACAGIGRGWTKTTAPSSFAATTRDSRRSSRGGVCREHGPARSRAGSRRSRPTMRDSRNGSAGRSPRWRPPSTRWATPRSPSTRSTRRLEYLQANVRNYPNSPDIYDSLGEGLEAAGRLDDALAKSRRRSSAPRRTKTPCSIRSARIATRRARSWPGTANPAGSTIDSAALAFRVSSRLSS